MIKKIFPFLSVIMLALFVGSCSNEDVMPEIDKGATSRTVTFEALMPGSGATTRVAADELADRTIDLTWEANDEIVLLFVQGETRKSATATVVSADGETGTFTVTLPEGIVGTADYTLYGAYGTAGAPTEGSTVVDLASTGDLGDKILLHFKQEVTGNAIGSVEFAHKGYVFTAKVEITGSNDITDISLVGNEAWAIGSSDYTFDLESGNFTTTATPANAIELENLVEEGGVATARSWFPATETELPALKLSVNGTVETANAKPSRTPEVGKAYYLYATWDGTDLVFADKDFNVPQTGTKISIAGLRENYDLGETYAEDHFIEGEVILNAEYGNANTKAAFIADGTAGISFFFAEEAVAAVPLGAKVKVNLLNATWSEFNGLRQLNMSTAGVTILEATATNPLEPRVVTLQDILDKKYQSELVQINDVQFDNVPAKYSANPNIEDADSKKVNVRTSSGATFAGDNVMEGNGPFIGVVSIYNTPQLLIRTTADLADMTGPRYVPPFINVNPFSLTFAKEGGSETIAVTANVAWTATSDADWLTIDPASGANDGAILVSATANSGADARSAIITITPDAASGLSAIEYSVTQAGSEAVYAETLFFSEYIEGSGSYNKGLEIYNGTGAAVDLSDYKVELYSNGSSAVSQSVVLSGILQHGEVVVLEKQAGFLYNGDAITIISPSVCNFNGDDAIALRKESTNEYIDIFGEIGKDPGSAWTATGFSTADMTLVRKANVKKGVAVNPVGKGFPTLSDEWIAYPKDTKTFLGSHTTDY